VSSSHHDALPTRDRLGVNLARTGLDQLESDPPFDDSEKHVGVTKLDLATALEGTGFKGRPGVDERGIPVDRSVPGDHADAEIAIAIARSA